MKATNRVIFNAVCQQSDRSHTYASGFFICALSKSTELEMNIFGWFNNEGHLLN
ncbi:hypothetical protein [Xenorhabdus stockiae]|uniref:hypothetical protein n=1 Tax=Xenorhabdus stockiae TaxID=351614 RepID=UPI0040634F01